MSVPSFFQAGVNYRGLQANWLADANFFLSIKNPNAKFPIRILAQTSIPQPWALGTPSSSGSGNFDYWRECALFFAAYPQFDVTFNVYFGPITNDSWQAMHDAIVAEATYLQSQGLPIEISLGNELEGTFGIAFSATSLSESNGVATLVTASKFPTHIGDTITIYGSNKAAFNSSFTVTGYDGNKTITFNVAVGTGTNTGSAFAISLSIAQLNANLRQLATDVKAVYNLGKVSYGCFDATVNSVSAFSDWETHGLGGLDTLSIHTYPGTSGKTGQKFMKPYPTDAPTLVSTLGVNNAYVSEFGVSSGGMSGMSAIDIVDGMRRIFTALNNMGVKKAIVWSWNGLLGADDNFEMIKNNGSYSPAWSVLLNQNGRCAISTSPISGLRSTVSRSNSNARSIVSRNAI